MFVALGIQPAVAYTSLYYRLWPVRLYHTVTHYLTNETIFGKKLFKIKYVSENFLIVRRIHLDMYVCVCVCFVMCGCVYVWVL